MIFNGEAEPSTDFLHEIDEILRTIRYVEKNPIEAGLSPQRWDYVVPFTPPRGRGR